MSTNISMARQRTSMLVRDIRKTLGLTQREMGRRLGVSHVYVGALERGTKSISMDSFDAMCRTLSVHVSMGFGECDGTARCLDAN